MSKRKPVEAWVWVNSDGIRAFHATRSEAERQRPFMALSNGFRLVRLVEHNPRAAAVVRAAVKWAETIDRRSVEIMIDVDGPLYDAVRRLRAKR